MKEYRTISESDQLKKYEQLKAEVGSPDFRTLKSKLENSIKEIKGKDEKDAVKKADLGKQLEQLARKESEFRQLEKSRAIKFYHKFGNSQKYKDFLAFEKSRELADFRTLGKYLASEEHKGKLAKLTEEEAIETAKVKKHQEFSNSKKYKWYAGLTGSPKFEPLEKWKVVFEDDFSRGELDRDK